VSRAPAGVRVSVFHSIGHDKCTVEGAGRHVNERLSTHHRPGRFIMDPSHRDLYCLDPRQRPGSWWFPFPVRNVKSHRHDSFYRHAYITPSGPRILGTLSRGSRLLTAYRSDEGRFAAPFRYIALRCDHSQDPGIPPGAKFTRV
jgi:hypothetical protein